MTIGHYHLHLKPISKAQGHDILAVVAYRHAIRVETQPLVHSVIAAAAYQRGQALSQGTTVHDYSRKRGVAWTGIIAPDDAPAWVHDPETLWKQVELTEHRSNARLAREIILGLPHGVPLDIHKELLSRFVRTHCLPRRMIADIAIHEPPTHTGGDQRNWHAHILLTDRPITANGFSPTKDRGYIEKDVLREFRQGWADIHNRLMQERGFPHRIDHRRLDVQRGEAISRGDVTQAIILDRLPQIHLGKAVHSSHPRYLEFAERRAKNQAILAANEERIAAHENRFDMALHETRQRAFEEKQRADHQGRLNPRPTFENLIRTFGRPTTWRHRWVTRHSATDAQAVMASNGWLPGTDDVHAPAMAQFLTERVRTHGAGHPWWHMSARDFAFAFYKLGLTSLEGLQTSLETIRREELNRHPQEAKKLRFPQLPRPTPRPHRARLRWLEQHQAHIQVEAERRHSQARAFTLRYQRSVQRASERAAERPVPARLVSKPLGLSRFRARTMLGTMVPGDTESSL